MGSEILFPLQHRNLPPTIGNKAYNLHCLMRKGFRVPAGYVCTWDAHCQYTQYPEEALTRVRQELAKTIKPKQAYAVRSSASLEDSFDCSFAGQFKSFLHVCGLNNLIEAVEKIWQASASPGVQTYLAKAQYLKDDLKMGVIFQEMVLSKVSGVAFSCNPLTGLDEVVIEAVHGSGEALVQEGKTPSRWINKWGDWLQKPDDSGISQELIAEVVDQTRRISRTFRQNVDLEWVYDGSRLYWVQMRPITNLNNVRVYSNHISREMLPGVIKPLIWSVNNPLVNSAWVALITELIGPNEIHPKDLSKYFYYHAYFDTTTFGLIFERLGFPPRSLEMMMGLSDKGKNSPRFRPSLKTVILIPRLVSFLWDKWNIAYRFNRTLPEIAGRFEQLSRLNPLSLDQNDLLDQIDQLKLAVQQAAYFNIVIPLLMASFNLILRRGLISAGLDATAYDPAYGMADLEKHDPNPHLSRLHNLFNGLEEEERQQIVQFGWISLGRGNQTFLHAVEQFLQQFGHLSDSGNDFSHTPWRENLDFILKMIAAFQPSAVKPDGKLTFEQLPLNGFQRRILGIMNRRARHFRLYREQISSTYTFGYGLFRNFYLALGRCFVEQGILLEPQDIFYLYDEEVRKLVCEQNLEDGFVGIVEERKQEIERVCQLELPAIIYGDQAPPVVPSTGPKMSGVPASRGYFTGRVKTVRGLGDFPKVQQGDVLVVPYSDVGWTPLFVKAGAVIAESGGLLSHSSIVAREYQIPAVVSVDGATRLKDGCLVTVDGYRGEVTIHDNLTIAVQEG